MSRHISIQRSCDRQKDKVQDDDTLADILHVVFFCPTVSKVKCTEISSNLSLTTMEGTAGNIHNPKF